jgi:flagellar capping protein FliD
MPEQDTAAEGEEEESSFDSEWKSFTHSETLETAPNLESFLLAQSSRKMATENFSLSLDECLNGLNEAIHDILNDSVVPIHNETLERFEACDADIVATMKSNHNRRATMTKCMEDANAKWTKQYQRLRQKIGQMNGSMVRFE